MKLRVHWIVSGEIETCEASEMKLKDLEELKTWIPPIHDIKREIQRKFETEIELIEVLDENGMARITFDYSPAGIQLYEGRRTNDKQRKTSRTRNPDPTG